MPRRCRSFSPGSNIRCRRGKFRPVARVLLALHGGKARPQEDGMLAILGVQPVDAVIDAAHPLGPQGLPEEVELGVALAAQVREHHAREPIPQAPGGRWCPAAR